MQFKVRGNDEPEYYVDLAGHQPCFCKDAEMRPKYHCKHVLCGRLLNRDEELLQKAGKMLTEVVKSLDETPA